MTGRILGDAAGTMTAAETIAKAGTVAKTSSNRYGDYNAMLCDPTYGSFWFSANYNPTSAPKTNIVHFKINSPAPAADAASATAISNAALKVAPNPANTYADIIFKSASAQQIPVQLVNTDGNVFAERMFYCLQGDNKLRIDLTNIPAGYYIVKLHTANGVVMQKMMVQK